ncbi:TetR family transcriptional regulator [Streptomyces sp. 840.1]|uniref:TetR/AcrR family transcriptional regulator C-terminal domain-containing protein n=1 Tax=Streptomyces sp. 840.1 TaxID=2485152 RepID=UPI000F487367|nr:TetR/AcrR family transcriptional regulator C-terminal domain-containing protein [Streptomyces sp. 840.1]ROQ66442.1 TetR family transcriptional regulator [Streptomyces sp. 840.1]
MVVYAGQGDARRSMSLLWRSAAPPEPGRAAGPGPRQGLTVDAIVAAAIAVADEDGMAALSMRAVGERLGRTAMALYTYVPGKSELLDLMYDAAHAELPAGRAPGGDWRTDLTEWARDTLAFYLRHPWVLQVSQARPVLGPHEYAALDALVRLLRGTGLDAGVLRRLVGTLFHFVRGAAQTVADARGAASATGRPDEEWWYARSAALGELVPDFADRYPELSRMERESAPPQPAADDAVPYPEREAREMFDAGLGVLLDGVEAAVRRGGRGAGRANPP